jgi:hypothetical protein
MIRRWGGGCALLIAALLPAACMKSVEFDHPAVGGGGGSGTNGVGGKFGNGGNGFGDGGASDASVDSHLHCSSGQPISISVSPETPSIMVALDRSPSMRNPLDGSTPRFQVVKDAISATLTNYQPLATFGYVEFPGDNGDPSCPDGCCAGGFVPLIAPSSSTGGAASSISTMMNKCWSPSMQQYNCIGSGVSPSGHALQKIAKTFRNTQTSGGQLYALLLTDGPPTCPLFSSNAADSCDDAATQASGMNLGTPNIGTFVVAVGDIDPRDGQCFTNLASAGGHPNTTGPNNWYVADTEALVHSQVDRIVASTICHLNVSPNQQPFDPSPSRLEVDVRGAPAPIPNVDSTNGYVVTTTASGTHIDFVGRACDALNAARIKGSRITVQGCQPSFPAPAR